MTRIYLVRHAEAEGNLYRRAQGWYDGRVTDTGKLQIAALERRFQDIQVDAAYASDLRRTQTTAQAVVRPKGLPLRIDPDLKEIGMGIYEDRTFGDLHYHHPEGHRLFALCSPDWAPEGGESFQQVQDRMLRAFFRAAMNHPDQTVALFSHGAAIKCLLAALRGKHPGDAPELGHPENTAVSCIEVDAERFRVLFENDASHLPDEIATMARQRLSTDREAPTLVWFRPMDLQKEVKLYTDAREDAWASVHGSLEGYDGPGFLSEAAGQQALDPKAIQAVMLEDRPIGVLQLATMRYAAQQVGYIPFLYLMPRWQGKGVGIQLIGQAVSTYRAMGRRCLQLRCAPGNAPAQRFYQRCGFYRIDTAPGSRTPLDLLEKSI